MIPSELYSLIKLTYLCINRTDISSLGNEIVNLTNLKELHLGSNNLTSLPSALTNLKHLEILSIDNNITSIPPISSLRELYISMPNENNLLPAGLENLKNLTTLTLVVYSNRDVVSLIRMVKKLPKLHTLKLLECPLVGDKEIREIASIRTLKELEMTACNFKPDFFRQFPPMENLTIHNPEYESDQLYSNFYTELSKIPTLKLFKTNFHKGQAANYSKLKCISIEFDFSSLDPLSEAVPLLKDLTCLKSMKVVSFESSLMFLQNVREMDISSANKVDISFAFKMMAEMKSLKKLTISNDQLIKFPPETEMLKNLEELVIYNFRHGLFDAIDEEQKGILRSVLPSCKITFIEN
jgi:internalin A